MRITSLFLSLIVRRFVRSPSFGKDITIQIILAFIAALAVGYFLILGFALEEIIVNLLKHSNAVAFLNGLLVYYFIAEFVTRYFIQSLPALDVKPLLHLPIKRSKIANFFLGTSLIQVFIVVVPILFGPFAFTAVARGYGITQAWVWLLSVWLISLILHYLIILLKLTPGKRGWRLFFIIVICGLVAVADYFAWIKLSLITEKFFNTILEGYTVIAALFFAVISLYYVAHRSILKRLYPEEPRASDGQISGSTHFSFLENFGQTGMWLKIELKMIFRNKRTREVFFMSTMLFFQELVFCLDEKNRSYGVFLFFGIACTGMCMGNYGQYTFSWQGDHFDFTLAQPTSLRSYVESKAILLALMTGAWFLCTVPFVYFGWEILVINLASALYNVGVNTFVVMNMAMLHTTKLTLRRGGALNYEGAGAAQWLMGIPFLFGPIIIYAPFSQMGHKELGIAAVGLVGMIGILLYKKMMELTHRRFLHRRYLIASSFRKE